jgi:hypothetical protein
MNNAQLHRKLISREIDVAFARPAFEGAYRIDEQGIHVRKFVEIARTVARNILRPPPDAAIWAVSGAAGARTPCRRYPASFAVISTRRLA